MQEVGHSFRSSATAPALLSVMLLALLYLLLPWSRTTYVHVGVLTLSTYIHVGNA